MNQSQFSKAIKSLLIVLAVSGLQSCAEKVSTETDWPQFKKDNHRSGNSSVQLDLNSLGEDWVYTASQKPVPAWYGPAKEDTYANSGPLPSMRDYDLAYYPIIVGERLYYGSSSDNAIHCLNAITGEEVWTYTTGGPIRVAPTYYKGKLYFGSDDGYAYSIKASNGKLVWKFSPTEEHHEKVMNNNSMISFWPVRTGVLIENDIAYFGASLLPWKESYFCAVDVSTGEAADGVTYIQRFEDLTLEGAMASTGTRIVQPQGRISPIFFNKSDGAIKGQLPGTGGCFVLVTPDLNIVHPESSRAKSMMESFINEINPMAETTNKQAQFMSFKGGKEMVVKDSMNYILTDNSISAYNRNSKKVEWVKRNYNAHRIIISGDMLYVGGTDKLYAVSTKNGHSLWETEVKGTVYAIAVANNALYASTGDGQIYRFAGSNMENPLYAQNKDKPAVIDKVGKEKEEVAVPDFDIATGPFISALGPETVEVHFFTEEAVVCDLNWYNEYGNQVLKDKSPSTEHKFVVKNVRKDFSYNYQIKSDSKKSKLFEYDNFFNYTSNLIIERSEDAGSELFNKIQELNEEKKGVAIVFGKENEDIALEIARHSPLKVILFETSSSKVNKLRKKWQATGLYGGRITAHQVKDLSDLPITSDVANIVVVNATAKRSANEVIRLVKPDGYAVVSKKSNNVQEWLKNSDNAWLVDHTVQGNFELLKKAPYETSGKWTHQYGAADNSAFGGEGLWGSTSTDDFEIQWMGRPGPRFQTDRSGRKPSPLAVNGKMFVQGKERIIAVDAYNGNVFWSKEIPELVRMNVLRDCSNWTADDDYIYIAHKNNLLKIKAENGDMTSIIPVNKKDEKAENDWGYIALYKDNIIGSTIVKGSNYTNYHGGAGWYDAQSGPLTHQVLSSTIFAQKKDGATKDWVYKKTGAYILNPTITITNNQLVFVETRNRNFKYTDMGRGGPDVFKNMYMVSINPETGVKNWEKPINTQPGLAAYFMAGSADRIVIVASYEGAYYIYNYSSENGDLKWENELKWPANHHGAHFSRPGIVNNRLIVKPGMFRLDTGELLKEEVPKAGHGCATYALTEQSAFYRGGSVTQFNFDTNKFSKWERLRPDCWLSTIPAQGLVLSPEAGGGCSCGNWLETSMVFTPKSRAPLTFIYNEQKFIDTLSITIKTKNTSNNAIYYTTDGSTPTKSSQLYKEPIVIEKSTNLQAVIYAKKNDKEIAFSRSKEFERTRPAPVVVEIPQLIDGQWQFTMQLNANSGEIYYTIDGSEPTVDSPKYEGPVVIQDHTLIRAKTFWIGDDASYESKETSFDMRIPELEESVGITAEKGIVRNYYKGDKKKGEAIDLSTLTPLKSEVVDEISVEPFKNETMFGLQFSGYINIPVDGVYTLSSYIQGGLYTGYVHDKMELENKGGEEKSKVLFLKEGLHPIRFDYLIENGNGYFELQLEGPAMKKQSIASSLLYN